MSSRGRSPDSLLLTLAGRRPAASWCEQSRWCPRSRSPAPGTPGVWGRCRTPASPRFLMWSPSPAPHPLKHHGRSVRLIRVSGSVFTTWAQYRTYQRILHPLSPLLYCCHHYSLWLKFLKRQKKSKFMSRSWTESQRDKQTLQAQNTHWKTANLLLI